MVGSIVLSVTFTINRFLLLRYSAAVMLNTSVTFTVVLTGSEATPPELMAVMVSVASRRSRSVEGNSRAGGTRRSHTQVSLHYSQGAAGGREQQSSSRGLRYGEQERCPRRNIGIRAGDQDVDIRGVHGY